MNFKDIGLHETLLKALTEAGYTAPTPVQAQAIPAIIEGNDVLVSSQTGSGKTAAFMLPILNSLAHQERPPFRAPIRSGRDRNRQGRPPRHAGKVQFEPAQPRVLVLAPTRELATQVTEATFAFAHHIRHLKAVSILGGMPYPKQMELLSRNPEILVATPGRLIDHMESGKIDFSGLQVLVLDEADRMLDMGFIDDIEKVISKTPQTRQTLLFSATLDGAVGEIASKITRDPVRIQISAPHTKHENITQRLHYVDDAGHKNRLLDHILRDSELNQAVVFTATKREADHLSDRLNIAGFVAAPLHGDMHQGARNRTLKALRSGQLRILVATDVAARGIDVPSITHVINFDLPKFAEDYVHRIGRTGRAGRQGIAISLVSHDDSFAVRKIERFTRQIIPVETVDGHEPQKKAPSRASRPSQKPGRRNGKNFSSPRPSGKTDHKPAHKGAHNGRSDSHHGRPGQSRSSHRQGASAKAMH